MEGSRARILGSLPKVFSVPSMWKLAKGIPSNIRDNYRSITLTFCRAKILERMVLNKFHPLVDPTLDECQTGFRWGSDLLAHSLDVTWHMRKHTRTYCAFMDIRKAFDVAWRDGAMLRLHRAGVQGGYHFKLHSYRLPCTYFRLRQLLGTLRTALAKVRF